MNMAEKDAAVREADVGALELGAGDDALAGPGEVVAVALGVEPDGVRGEEPPQQLLAPGQSGEQLGWREGDVEEEPDGARRVQRPDLLGHLLDNLDADRANLQAARAVTS